MSPPRAPLPVQKSHVVSLKPSIWVLLCVELEFILAQASVFLALDAEAELVVEHVQIMTLEQSHNNCPFLF